MPLVRLQVSVKVDNDKRKSLMERLSGTIAKQLGKPESYMMVVLEPETPILMAGSPDPAALAEVRSVGEISPDQATSLSGTIGEALSAELAIKPDRAYITFTGFPATMWGFNGRTFG
jgi:phenylpyruvate tautomerase PptA (4-oxalocrotonate tautomerase family)